MKQTQIQISDVFYNAATQCFEALVSVGPSTDTKKYPCSIKAPMSMGFDEAAKGLSTQALRQHSQKSGMYSQMRGHVPKMRNGRERFDPRTWLAQLGLALPDKAA